MNHRDIRRWVLFVLALCLLITAILLLTAPQLVLPFLLSALLWNAVSAALIHPHPQRSADARLQQFPAY